MTNSALIEILSEAAVEIYNASGPGNIVVQRLRRAIAELDDPQYWHKRAKAAAHSIGLAAEAKQLGTDLMHVAAGQPPKKEVA